MTTKTKTKVRPIRPSRKKFQEALRCLKQAAKTPTIPWIHRLRACELICSIYGVVPLPDIGANRTRKVIKDLVEEHEFERRMRTELETKTRARIIGDAEAAARAFLAETAEADTEDAGTEADAPAGEEQEGQHYEEGIDANHE